MGLRVSCCVALAMECVGSGGCELLPNCVPSVQSSSKQVVTEIIWIVRVRHACGLEPLTGTGEGNASGVNSRLDYTV